MPSSVVICAALIAATALLMFFYIETAQPTRALQASPKASAQTAPFANFYYNNSYVSTRLETAACKKAVLAHRFSTVDDCLRNQSEGWQWIKYNHKESLQCVAKLRVRPQYNLASCGKWRGGALNRVGDSNYACPEQLCSFSTMGDWTSVAATMAEPDECITYTTEAACQGANCDWIDGITTPFVYTKCVDGACPCEQHVGKKYKSVYNTQCCNGMQCLCQCKGDTTKKCLCDPQVNACSWGWSESARAGAPSCWDIASWGARRVKKGASNGIIAGCGFPEKQLRVGKDWLRLVTHADNDAGAAADVVNNSS